MVKELKNSIAQKLREKSSMELNGITVHFWTGHTKESIATQHNWNKVKSCSFYNQHSTGDNGHIVVTGIMQIPRHEVLEYATKLGLKVHSTVTLETNLIVLGSDNVSPTKIAKALKLIEKGYQIEFLDENAFLEIVIDNLDINDVACKEIHEETDNKKKPIKNKSTKNKANITIEQISNKLSGQTFVISGTFEKYSRDELKELISKFGGKNTGPISAKTNYLLAGENIGPSKLEKVKKLNIPIISKDDFLKMIE